MNADYVGFVFAMCLLPITIGEVSKVKRSTTDNGPFDDYPECSNVEIPCFNDIMCNDSHICLKNKCVDACSCEPCEDNEKCQATNHTAMCECSSNLVYNEQLKCVPPFIACSSDDDCGIYKTCRNQRCIDLYINSHYPCSDDNDCHYSEKCKDEVCVNVCKDINCGSYETCIATNHSAICECHYGPRDINVASEGRCRSAGGVNYDCHITNVDNTYARFTCPDINAECTYPNNICKCSSGYIRNLLDKCVRVKGKGDSCRDDDDCHFFEACKKGTCVNPCLSLNCVSSPELSDVCQMCQHSAMCPCNNDKHYFEGLEECIKMDDSMFKTYNR